MGELDTLSTTNRASQQSRCSVSDRKEGSPGDTIDHDMPRRASITADEAEEYELPELRDGSHAGEFDRSLSRQRRDTADEDDSEGDDADVALDDLQKPLLAADGVDKEGDTAATAQGETIGKGSKIERLIAEVRSSFSILFLHAYCLCHLDRIKAKLKYVDSTIDRRPHSPHAHLARPHPRLILLRPRSCRFSDILLQIQCAVVLNLLCHPRHVSFGVFAGR